MEELTKFRKLSETCSGYPKLDFMQNRATVHVCSCTGTMVNIYNRLHLHAGTCCLLGIDTLATSVRHGGACSVQSGLKFDNINTCNR